MAVTPKQKRYLRGLAHGRKSIVGVGQAGLTANVLSEIDLALHAHELIKVRIGAGDRAERTATGQRICEQTGCELIQSIGQVITLYRANPEGNQITLPGPA